MNKVVIAVLVGIVLIASGALTVSGYSSVVPQYHQPSFQIYGQSSVGEGLGNGISTYWPALDKETCDSRQDMILQVAPLGCEPQVVRSDLLAEQDVPVFCQITATKLNPLLDIKEIRSIRFDRQYSSDVRGVGFHPARAALRSRDNLLG